MTKVFHKGLMISEQVLSKLASVVYQDSDTDAAIHDGAFVVLGDMVKNSVYGEAGNLNDYNVYNAKAPEAVTDPVVVVDIADISQGVIAGNNYKIGVKLVDLVGQAGYPMRARRMEVGDKFWLGRGNFASAPTVGQFAILTASDTILTPNGTKAESGFCVKIQASKDLTLGQFVAKADGSAEQIYLCEVVQL